MKVFALLSLLLPLATAQQAATSAAAVSTTAVASTPAASTPAALTPAAAASTTQQAAAVTTTAAAQTSSTALPAISFSLPATMTACATNALTWALYNEAIGSEKFVVNLFVYNLGVDQSTPSTTSAQPAVTSASAAASTTPTTSAAAQAQTTSAAVQQQTTSAAAQSQTTTAAAQSQTTAQAGTTLVGRDQLLVGRANVNSSIVSNWQANVRYNWVTNVPAGKYRIYAIVNDTQHTVGSSGVFTVVAGSNTTCLHTTNTTSSSTSSKSAEATSDANNTATTKKGLSGGAIAGVVIGVLAGLAILGAVLFYCMRRRRGDYSSRGGRNEPISARLIGAPSRFKRGSSMGLGTVALSSKDYGEHDTDPERGEKRETPPRNGRTTAMSTNTDPFETAPSTPFEERTNPVDAGGVSLAAAAALAGGARRGSDNPPRPPPHDYPPRPPPPHGKPPLPPSHRPTSVPLTASDRSGTLAPFDGPGDDYRLSTMSGVVNIGADDDDHLEEPRRLPPAPYTPGYTPGGSPAPQPSLPTTPTNPSGMSTQHSADNTGHKSAKSSGGESSDSGGAHSGASHLPSHGPSSFANTPRAPERKNSLRRKPVPQLVADETSLKTTGQSPKTSPGLQGSSRPMSDREHSSHAAPEQARPAGDQFGLSAALTGLGHNTFQLMPDPPLSDERH